MCRERSIAESLLLRWRKKYEECDEGAFTPKQPSREEALEAQVMVVENFIGQLTVGNSMLKNASRRTPLRSVSL